MSSFQTLSAPWTPESSCLASTAYYQAVWATGTSSGGETWSAWDNLFGNPTPASFGPPSGACLPPSYTQSVPYVSDSCPDGYSAACRTDFTLSGQPATSVRCCPSGVFDFACPQPSLSYPYGCFWAHTSNTTFTGWMTDFAHTPRTGEPITYTATADSDGIVAWAVEIVVTPATSTSTSTSSSSPTNTHTNTPGPPEQQSGLTTGAKAGIGVGVGVGALALLGAVVLMLLRRRGKKTVSPTPASASVSPYEPGPAPLPSPAPGQTRGDPEMAALTSGYPPHPQGDQQNYVKLPTELYSDNPGPTAAANKGPSEVYAGNVPAELWTGNNTHPARNQAAAELP